MKHACKDTAMTVKKPLPSGEYYGAASGYTAYFTIGNNEYRTTMPTGIRGMNVPCMVTVDADGRVFAEVKQ